MIRPTPRLEIHTDRIAENLLLAGIEFNWTPAGVIVPPAPGQGIPRESAAVRWRH